MNTDDCTKGRHYSCVGWVTYDDVCRCRCHEPGHGVAAPTYPPRLDDPAQPPLVGAGR